MENQKKTSPVDIIWDLFSSVKLAIVIFALIALTSVVGTVIEQQAEPEKNLKILSNIVGEGMAPSVYKIADALGFMDMYHSWWFLVLLLLFASNLIICSIDRFPGIWRLVKAPIHAIKAEGFRGHPIYREYIIKDKAEKLKAKASFLVGSLGFKPQESSEDGGVQLYAQKGAFTRLGVYITHLSIILILLGAVIGIVFGFKGFLNLPEGETYTVAFANVGRVTEEEAQERNIILNAVESSNGDIKLAASKLGVTVDRLQARMKRFGIQPLGFAIRCDDFEVAYYDRSDMPREYTSLLSIKDGNKKIEPKWIEVNDPLIYKGFYFYQSSYGVTNNISKGLIILKITAPDGSSDIKRVHFGEKFRLGNSNITLMAADFSPALAYDENGKPFTYKEDMIVNPAVLLQEEGGNQSFTKWVMKRRPETWSFPDGYTIQFMDLWGSQYTGLQVRKDPGVLIVYFGCITMSIGLFINFFMSHRKIWVKLIPEKNNTKVLIAAYANKNRQPFESKIEKAAAALLQGGKQ